MKIITIIGPDKVRKTSVIRRVYKKLRGCVFNTKFYKKCGNDRYDFMALIKHRGKKIAFCSIGDPADINKKNHDYKHLPSEYILAGLVFASEKEADILINAYSNSDTNPFPEFSNKTYESLVNIDKYQFVPITMLNNVDLDEQERKKIHEVMKYLK